MSIEDVITKRKEVEAKIIELLNIFEAESGLEIANVTVGHCETMQPDSTKWERSVTCRVHVEI